MNHAPLRFFQISTKIPSLKKFASLIGDDVNESMNAFAETLQQITDKHAPVRKLSNKMRTQLRKPRITSAILKSIKKR